MIDIPTTITTAAQTYTPPSGSIVLPSKTYFGQRGEYEPVPLVQYDDTLPIIAAALYLNGQPYTVPDGAAVNIRMAKGDGTYVYNPALGVSEDRQTAYIAVTYQMTVIAGNYCPILELVVSGDVAGTSELPLQIAENPVPEDAIASTDEYKTIQQLAAEVQEAAAIITENEQAIQDIEDNLAAIQGAAGNAQSAAASAARAQQYASSINPANFATAEQGAKADTAMQPADGIHLYSATLLADSWTSAGSGKYTQTAALTPLTGGPAVTSDSVLTSAVMCEQTTVQSTNETLQEALGIINSGNTVLGANQVTVTVFEVPEADVEAIWQIKRGVLAWG